jgi:hypothetical protein
MLALLRKAQIDIAESISPLLSLTFQMSSDTSDPRHKKKQIPQLTSGPALDTRLNTDTSIGAVLKEDTAVHNTLVNARSLVALLGNINAARTGRLLQNTDVVLAELGQIVSNETSLALELLVARGVQDLDAVGSKVKNDAEVVPNAGSELGLPESGLGAGAVVADEVQALGVFGRGAIAVEELARADGELVGGILGVLEPDKRVLVGVVQGARVVGLDAEVQGLDAGDAAVDVGGLGLQLSTAEASLTVGRGWGEDRAIIDQDLDGLGGRVVEESALGRGRKGKGLSPGQVGTNDIVLVVGQTAVDEAPAISSSGNASVKDDGTRDILRIVVPASGNDGGNACEGEPVHVGWMLMRDCDVLLRRMS